MAVLVWFAFLDSDFHVLLLLCSECSENLYSEHTRSKRGQNGSNCLQRNRMNFIIKQRLICISLDAFRSFWPFHFPMQKLLNIFPNSSSGVRCPVISPSASWAALRSSARSSPAP